MIFVPTFSNSGECRNDSIKTCDNVRNFKKNAKNRKNFEKTA